MVRRSLIVAIAAFCYFTSAFGAQERMTLWMTFDADKIGPAVACEGELRLSEGKLTLSEWLLEGKESAQGAKFAFSTEHNAQTAEAANVQIARRATLPKGLFIRVEAPHGSTLSGTTSLGAFDLPLARLRKDRVAEALDGKVRLHWIPNVTPLTGDQAEEDYPSVALLPDGRTAVAYVAWDGKNDRVFVRIGDTAQEITGEPGDYQEPRCATDGQGRLWVVWTANDSAQWDLWAYCDGARTRITSNPKNDFRPRLARDSQGTLWLAWQTVAENLHYEIMLAPLNANGLGPAVNVSEHPADDWDPALCATPDGRIVVAWDTYRNGSYDIYLREFTAGASEAKPLGPPRPVAATAKREAHAAVAADSKNRVWIAWDVSVENWGKHPTPAGPLHASRSTDVACLADGKLQRPNADFMAALPPPLAKCVEYPQVAVDGRDRLWVFFRSQNEVRPVYRRQKKQTAQAWSTWHVFATQYDGQKWTPPLLIAESNGRQDMRLEAARDANGQLLIVFAADGRTRRAPYMPIDYNVFLAHLSGFGAAPQAPALAEAPDLGKVTPAAPDPELSPLPREWSAGGKTYRLVIGDTHRHTDISRCANGKDGSLQDAYRYALNACALDWLAISDHDQDIMKHRNDTLQRPRQDYDWWRSLKYCDLYTIPGRFVALYGYEHGRMYAKGGGHKNVLQEQRGPGVQEADAPHELFAALAGSGAIAIPHQLADDGSRMDWEKWNADFERVGEIFQTRGSYEFHGCPRAAALFTPGFSMWDALAKGIRIGIIASSDHGQTHQARAGVYVEPDGFTRRGILEALRGRRAFGSTIAVVVQMRVGDRVLGEEFALAAAPRIEANLIAPADIVRVDVVRDGRFVYTVEPKKSQVSFSFEDADLKPGQSAYYYVRAQIGEKDFAWSSPVWITRTWCARTQ